MKIYQKIIIFGLALFTTLMCVFSFVDTKEGVYHTKQNMDKIMQHIENMSKEPHSIIHEQAHQNVINYITDTIESFGITQEDTTSKPAYLLQSFLAPEVNEETYDLTNIIVSLPANSNNKTNNAIMFMAHHDSVAMGNGASDDICSIAAMLETINYYFQAIKNDLKIDNDLIFVFVDGEEFGLYGSQYFVSDFKGFNNVATRIKFAVNLESRGTSGTLIMFETSKNNYNTIKLFASVNQNIFTSSIANLVYQSMPNGTDYSNLKDCYQGLNMANLGGGESYHSQNDTYENVSKVYVSQQAVIMDGLINKLANYDLTNLYSTNQDAIFFSYLNISTVVYSNTLAIIFAVITILLLVGNIILGIVYKNKNIIKTLKGYIVSLIALISSALITFIAYYVYQLVAVLAGVIDIHMLGTITYTSTPLMVGIVIMSFAICALISSIFIKLLKIDGVDVRRGIAYILAFLGIGLSFVLPEVSYLFIFTGLLLLIIEVLSSLKIDINKYHLELLVFGLSCPIFILVIDLASAALGMTMCYVYGAIAALEFMYIVPTSLSIFKYITLAKLMNVFNKKKEKKLEKETRGSLLIIGLVQIIFLFSVIFPAHPSMNLQGKQNIKRLPYDDALVLVAKEENNNSYNVDFRVYDLNTYPYMKKVLTSGYKWDNKEKAYTKDMGNQNIIFNTNIVKTSNSLNITRGYHSSIIYLTIKKESNIEEVNALAKGKSMVFEIDSQIDTTLFFYNDVELEFVNKNGDPIVADIDYLELMINYEPIKNQFIDFKALESNSSFKYNVWLLKEFIY